MERDTHLIDATAIVIPGVTTAGGDAVPTDDGLVDELLIEEISIDGMCGVY